MALEWWLWDTNSKKKELVLPATEDSLYREINNQDEATVTIANYALSDDYRLNWNKKFKPWRKGIALIDTELAWNNANKIHFLGIIVKRSFDGGNEQSTFRAYTYWEFLKKAAAKPLFTDSTSAAATTTFDAGTWGGVYAKIINSAKTLTGAPSGSWFIDLVDQMPATTGTGKSITTRDVEQEKVSELFLRIRDDISKGEEFKFVPKFTTSAADTFAVDLIAGTDSQPHINEDQNINVPLYENAQTFYAREYTVDDDATLVYNRISINGSTDATTAKYKNGYSISSDPELPILSEVFNPGVNLDDAQLAAQITARTKNTTITEKDIQLTLTNDTNNSLFGHLGKRITVLPGVETAGGGVLGRIVGLRWSSDYPGDFTVDVMKLQDRYPKLPKQKDDEAIGGVYPPGDNYYDDIVNNNYGGGGGGGGIPVGGGDYGDWGGGNGGWVPGGQVYVPPTDPGAGSDDGQAIFPASVSFTSTELITNAHANGWYYYFSGGLYNNATDGWTTNLSVVCKRLITSTTTLLNPTVTESSTIGTASITTADLVADMNVLPASYTLPGANNLGTPTSTRTSTAGTSTTGIKIVQGWVVGNKLHVLVTKDRAYTYGHRYGQVTYIYDIDPATGLLSNRVKGPKFGAPTYNYEHLFMIPAHGNNTNSVPSEDLVVMSNKDVLFFNCTTLLDDGGRYLDYAPGPGPKPDLSQIEGDWGIPRTLAYGALPVIQGDYTDPAYPIYFASPIAHAMPLSIQATTTSSYDWYWKADGGWVNQNFPVWRYVSTNNDGNRYSLSSYYWDDKNKRIIAVNYGAIPDNMYSNVIEERPIMQDTYQRRFWSLKPLEGETEWKSITDTLIGKLIGSAANMARGYMPIVLDGNAYVSTQPTLMYGNSSFETLKVGTDKKWKPSKTSLASAYGSGLDIFTSGDTIGQLMGLQQILKTDKGDVSLLRPDYAAGYRVYFFSAPSPFKKKGKSFTNQAALDNEGRVWQVAAVENGMNGKYWNLGVLLGKSTEITLKFKQITNGLTTSRVTAGIDSDDLLWVWGSNANYLTGLNTATGTTALPTQPIAGKKWKKVVMGSSHVAALDFEGKLWTWGANTNGQTGRGTTTGNTQVPTQVGTDSWLDIEAGVGITFVINSANDAFRFGNMSGTGNVTTPTALPGGIKFREISAGTNNYAGITLDYKLYTWGSNANGATGQGTVANSTVNPTQVGTESLWKTVVASTNITAAIKRDGSLWACGQYNYAGHEQTTDELTPKRVDTAIDYDTIWKISNSYVAVKKSGKAYKPFSNSAYMAYKWEGITWGLVPVMGDEVEGFSFMEGTEGLPQLPGFGGGGPAGEIPALDG